VLARSDAEKLLIHARDRIAPMTPQINHVSGYNDVVDDAASSSPVVNQKADKFESEISAYLPGLPGVRQSKDYKKIRRKITEIDDLIEIGIEQLDYCQRKKVERRGEYVQMIIDMLSGSASDERDNFVLDSSTEQQPPLAPIETPDMIPSFSPVSTTDGNVFVLSPETMENAPTCVDLPTEPVYGSKDQESRGQGLEERSVEKGKYTRRQKKLTRVTLQESHLTEHYPVPQITSLNPLFTQSPSDILAQLGDWVCDCLGEFFVGRDSYYRNN
jgi:hypothetical protein